MVWTRWPAQFTGVCRVSEVYAILYFFKGQDFDVSGVDQAPTHSRELYVFSKLGMEQLFEISDMTS